MKCKLSVIAALSAVLALSACGGSSGDDAGGKTPVSSPAALTKTDTTVGTGAEAVSGSCAAVDYTLWLYNSASANFKGTQVETGTVTFAIGAGRVIAGFDQGVTGMKVAGKRTVLIPSSLGYGVAGQYPVPPNSGLVFELSLKEIKNLSAALCK